MGGQEGRDGTMHFVALPQTREVIASKRASDLELLSVFLLQVLIVFPSYKRYTLFLKTIVS